MNRGVLSRAAIAAAGAALVALAVLGASTLPVQQPASVTAPDDDRARVGVVCPTIGEATVLAAGSPQGRLALAALDEPDGAQPVDGALGTEPATAPMVITAPRLDPFSATTRTAASTGSDRGLSMASCPRPGASAWFTGVRSSDTGAAEVVLLNADAQDATVDLSVYAARGRVNAPGSRGIVVPARSRRVVPLGPLFTLEQAVSLQVSTSAGRVAAMVRQRMLRDDRPAGSDWVPPTADPATTVVIPGLPAGKGGRDLVVVNPGERTASVALQVLGASGPVALPGFETIELPPQTSRVVDLARPLAGGAAGLRLTSEKEIAAGVISGSGGDAATAAVMAEVYGGDIEKVDTMVGMFGEKLPEGFGFSDTAFRIFVLMASRRLKSDRFYTVDFTPRVYTPEGMDWIDRNDMVSVLLRHYPELEPALRGQRNAFAPWRRL